jgi:hypothetical protein
MTNYESYHFNLALSADARIASKAQGDHAHAHLQIGLSIERPPFSKRA